MFKLRGKFIAFPMAMAPPAGIVTFKALVLMEFMAQVLASPLHFRFRFRENGSRKEGEEGSKSKELHVGLVGSGRM